MNWSLEFFRLSACVKKTGIFPAWYDGLCTGNGNELRINSVSDVLTIVLNVTQIAIAISGGLAILFILLSSIYYIASLGDPGRIKQAKDMIQNTVIGLVVIIMSYAVVNLIAKGL